MSKVYPGSPGAGTKFNDLARLDAKITGANANDYIQKHEQALKKLYDGVNEAMKNFGADPARADKIAKHISGKARGRGWLSKDRVRGHAFKKAFKEARFYVEREEKKFKQSQQPVLSAAAAQQKPNVVLQASKQKPNRPKAQSQNKPNTENTHSDRNVKSTQNNQVLENIPAFKSANRISAKPLLESDNENALNTDPIVAPSIKSDTIPSEKHSKTKPQIASKETNKQLNSAPQKPILPTPKYGPFIFNKNSDSKPHPVPDRSYVEPNRQPQDLIRPLIKPFTSGNIRYIKKRYQDDHLDNIEAVRDNRLKDNKDAIYGHLTNYNNTAQVRKNNGNRKRDIWTEMVTDPNFNRALCKYMGTSHFRKFAYDDSYNSQDKRSYNPFQSSKLTEYMNNLKAEEGKEEINSIHDFCNRHHLDEISLQEATCVKSYANFGYYPMNCELRGQAGFKCPLVKKSVQLTQSGLMKCPQNSGDEKGQVYRGAYVPADSARTKYAEGTSFRSEAFQSTSTLPEMASGGGNYLFTIKTSGSNTTARDIEMFKIGNECEALFPVGTSFTTVSRSNWKVYNKSKNHNDKADDNERFKTEYDSSHRVLCDSDGNTYDHEALPYSGFAIRQDAKDKTLSLVDSDSLEPVQGLSLKDFHPPMCNPYGGSPNYYCEVTLEENSKDPFDVVLPPDFSECPDLESEAVLQAIEIDNQYIRENNKALVHGYAGKIQPEKEFDKEMHRFFSCEAVYEEVGLESPPHWKLGLEEVEKRLRIRHEPLTVDGYLNWVAYKHGQEVAEQLKKKFVGKDVGKSSGNGTTINSVAQLSFEQTFDRRVYEFFGEEKNYKKFGLKKAPHAPLAFEELLQAMKGSDLDLTVEGYMDYLIMTECPFEFETYDASKLLDWLRDKEAANN